MLSYRHAFHAGNYADVLKHALLSRVLTYMVQKPKPLYYLETHAGRGVYDLTSFEANKTGEFSQGIARLSEHNLPDELSPYLNCVRSLCQGDKVTAYPGSPWLAQSLLRSCDRLHFCELHPRDFLVLQKQFARNSQVRCFEEDGYSKALALLPPKEKRGVVLIDPSYEVKTEYQQVVSFLKQAHAKFEAGVFILWYPIVSLERTERLKRQLVATGIRRVSIFELNLESDHEQPGMTGSGLLVINPPWSLQAEMKAILPYLAERFTAKGAWLAEELVGE